MSALAERVGRLPVAGTIAVLCVLGLTAQAPPTAGAEDAPREAIGEDVEVERLADGVWRHVSYHELESWGRVPANGLVVVSDGEAALLDTPWTDDQTRALAEWVRTELGARVTIVVPTHSHIDCMGGLAAAHELGARSYALDTTAELARRDGLPEPEETFESERTVHVGSRRLELRYFGPGHTVDNAVVWIPDVKVLFAGDIVRSAGTKALGNTREADLEAWPASLVALEDAYGASADIVVPGHGAPGGPELIAHTRDLLRVSP
jgi:metallo-beta-lactamase class B